MWRVRESSSNAELRLRAPCQLFFSPLPVDTRRGDCTAPCLRERLLRPVTLAEGGKLPTQIAWPDCFGFRGRLRG